LATTIFIHHITHQRESLAPPFSFEYMEISILKKLGLSDKDINIYKKLLEHGASSVRDLALVSGLNRGTTYDVLKKLQDVGLASYYHQDTKQNFVAEDPDKILKLVKAREQELKDAEEKLHDLIPELKSLQDIGGEKPVTKFYSGKNGIKFILDDVLSRLKESRVNEYYVYSAPGVREHIQQAYPDFSKKRIKNKIRAKAISLFAGGRTYGLDERKWIETDKKMESNMTYILIYDGHCAFIAQDLNHKPVGVIIENKMIYETQKTIFLQLWGLLG
jgi:sugar-specific transcriptional regulator TrmB